MPLRMMFPFRGKAKLFFDERKRFISWRSTFGSPTEKDFSRFYSALRALKPDYVFVSFPLDRHQMHRNTTSLTLDALANLSGRTKKPRSFFYRTASSRAGVDIMASFFEAGNLINLIVECHDMTNGDFARDILNPPHETLPNFAYAELFYKFDANLI